MATPPNQKSRYDALYDWCGLRIFNYVRSNFDPHTTTILDVGAGWGKYRDLFPDYTMDANEIYGIYIENELLESRYRTVYPMDICDLVDKEEFRDYGVIIMGDVLEHIETERAVGLVEKLCDHCEELIVAVPFEMEQHGDDNPYEEHLQPDLTPALMEKRYPQLKPLELSDGKGIYIKR